MLSRVDFFPFFANSTPFDMHFIGFFVHFVGNFGKKLHFLAFFRIPSGNSNSEEFFGVTGSRFCHFFEGQIQ